ncbi:MAG: UDP-N-acetylmuramoyl-L-alanyl-D-glutamate--2,6-diaminopimelate ligase [Elusimicrobiota bacterium]
MRLSALLSGVRPLSFGDAELDVSSLVLDSRKASAGSLFFALPGTRSDGNRHVREAIEKGAAAIVSELKSPPAPIAMLRRDAPGRSVSWVQVTDVLASMARMAANFYGDPSARLIVIGVTGTNGKTTTTYLLESIIAAAGGVPGVIGTVEHRVAGRRLEAAANTTPFSLDLTRLLARMLASGATHAAMEVSSHALVTQRVSEVHFDAAVMTNLQSDHLDFHKTREAYFEAKAGLFTLLERADSVKPRRVAVLNKDDETYCRLRHRVLDEKIVSYGTSPDADYRAEEVQADADGIRFALLAKGRRWPATLRLIGRYNVHNALGAAAAALELGLTPEAVLAGLASLAGVPGRLERVRPEAGPRVFVDYAHTTDAVAGALDTLRALAAAPSASGETSRSGDRGPLAAARLIVVFGCGGDRDKTKRGPMGEAACSRADAVIATSDNPRGEDPMEILEQVEQGMRRAGRENYRIVPDRSEAIREALASASPDDIVLIAGKGHETVQILKDGAVHFDDREVARAALLDLGK